MTLATAWGATLLASLLPDIAAQAFVPRLSRAWIGVGKVVLLSTGFVLITWVRPLQPISGYVLALAASALGDLGVAAITESAWWNSRQAAASEGDRLVAQALIHLIPTALMTLTVVGSLSRDQVFLAGVRTADIKLPLLPPLPWAVVASALAVLLAAPLLPDAIAAVRLASARHTLSVLPRALGFAAVNAGQEELRFRAILLARAAPTLGLAQALALTTLFFGLAHWFGRPSGPRGVVLAAVAGWVLGEVMLATGSFLPAWAMHGFLDVLIFVAVALRAASRVRQAAT